MQYPTFRPLYFSFFFLLPQDPPSSLVRYATSTCPRFDHSFPSFDGKCFYESWESNPSVVSGSPAPRFFVPHPVQRFNFVSGTVGAPLLALMFWFPLLRPPAEGLHPSMAEHEQRGFFPFLSPCPFQLLSSHCCLVIQFSEIRFSSPCATRAAGKADFSPPFLDSFSLLSLPAMWCHVSSTCPPLLFDVIY